MLVQLALVAQVVVASSLPATLANGDEAFVRIDYPAAVSIYEEVLQSQPSDPETLWRLARVYVCMAEVTPAPERANLLSTAEKYARACIGLAPERGEGHTWLAGALGYEALDAPAADQIRLSNEIVGELDRALAINPNDDAAYSIKGSFYRALGNIGWFRKELAAIFVGKVPDGGFPEAEAALKKAVELAPDIMRHQYELGVLYMDMGKSEEAIQCFERASRLPVRVAIDRPRLEKVKGFLAQLKK